MIGQLLGGIGLFLLGMILMTDGLKAAAGDALKVVLSRFTGGPFRGLLSGAALTALVQSSSATTLATIGFVSAGLLTFPSALGVIFGINVGTTSTGWIVSLLGLRFSMGAVAMPLVGLGALMRLLAPGRLGAYGTALAGFGLIFVGIDALQTGMGGLAERIDPSRFPQGPFFGRLLLVLIGVVMTVVMQSSSAAVATTLTALHSDAITLPQAAALVIGQNVGTTVKAILASIGGSIAVRRTAAAHVAFNLVTGVVAFALLPLFLMAAPWMVDTATPDGAATAIAIFHTGLNLLGVAMFLPFVHPFAALIMRMVPEKEHAPAATRFLDPTVAATGSVAVEAARRALVSIERDLALAIAGHSPERIEEARAGLAKARDFLAEVNSHRQQGRAVWRAHLSVMHALDHLDRLCDAACEDQHAPAAASDPVASRLSVVKSALGEAFTPLTDPKQAELPVEELRALSQETADWRRLRRVELLEEAAAGGRDPAATLGLLEAVRWVDRIAYHAWRALEHLGIAADPAEEPSEGSENPESGAEFAASETSPR